jgi:hypothetical protein
MMSQCRFAGACLLSEAQSFLISAMATGCSKGLAWLAASKAAASSDATEDYNIATRQVQHSTNSTSRCATHSGRADRGY